MTIKTLLIYGCLLLPSFALGQTPPSGLPKTLYECDVLASRKNCSIWTWTGQVYQGSWTQNGSVGTMTVEQFGPGGISIKRRDAAGAMKGMTATYTGTWNGSEVTDAHMAWTWNGYSANNTWTASSNAPAPDAASVATQKAAADAAIPVEIYLFKFGGNDVRFGVRNHGPAALTGYVYVGGRPDGNGFTHAEDFRVTQADLLGVGQERLDEHFYNTFNLPRGLKIIAATFADGTAKGDASWIQAMMDKRKEQIWTYEKMSHAVCGMGRQRQSASLMVTALTAKKSDYVRNASKANYVNLGGEQAYQAVITRLNAGALSADPDIVKKTLATVAMLSTKLRADPVKDASGKLYLADAVPQTSCELP